MIEIKTIIRVVSDRFGVRPVDIVSRRRHSEIALPRHVAMFIARALTGASFSVIARSFGRDHSTVIHAVSMIRHRLELDVELSSTVTAIIDALDDRYPTDAIDGLHSLVSGCPKCARRAVLISALREQINHLNGKLDALAAV